MRTLSLENFPAEPVRVIKEADKNNYRGDPDNHLMEKELQDKFADCTESAYSIKLHERIFLRLQND